MFGAPKRKPKQALLVTSQMLHDQTEEDGDNRNPLDESSLLQSTTNSIDTHTNTLLESSGHQKVFHASEKTVQSPIKSYKEETGKQKAVTAQFSISLPLQQQVVSLSQKWKVQKSKLLKMYTKQKV